MDKIDVDFFFMTKLKISDLFFKDVQIVTKLFQWLAFTC